MKLLLIMTIISILSAGEIRTNDLEPGRRGNQNRRWVIRIRIHIQRIIIGFSIWKIFITL